MSLFSIRLTLTLKLYSPLLALFYFVFSLRTGELASKVKSSTRSFQHNPAKYQSHFVHLLGIMLRVCVIGHSLVPSAIPLNVSSVAYNWILFTILGRLLTP